MGPNTLVRRWAQTPSHISENMIKTWSKCQSVYSNCSSKPQQEPLESIILAKVIITLHPQMFTPKCLGRLFVYLGENRISHFVDLSKEWLHIWWMRSVQLWPSCDAWHVWINPKNNYIRGLFRSHEFTTALITIYCKDIVMIIRV